MKIQSEAIISHNSASSVRVHEAAATAAVPSHFRRSFSGAALVGALALLLAFSPQTAEATTTATTTFAVTATVVATCSVSATAMAFANYTGVLATGSSAISVSCSNGVAYNIGLDAGVGASATTAARIMTGPSSAHLAYGLFSDSGYLTNWGDTISTDTVTGTSAGAVQSVTVYGKIAAGQLVGAGAFADTITATITY